MNSQGTTGESNQVPKKSAQEQEITSLKEQVASLQKNLEDTAKSLAQSKALADSLKATNEQLEKEKAGEKVRFSFFVPNH